MCLIGRVMENGDVAVDGYYIPKQSVTAASVRNEEPITLSFIKEYNVVASIHSHANMQVFFSSTDEQTNRSLIRYHIVTNNRGDYLAVGRVMLPCGAQLMLDVEVVMCQAAMKGEVIGMDKIERPKTFGLTTYKGIVKKVRGGHKGNKENYKGDRGHGELFRLD